MPLIEAIVAVDEKYGLAKDGQIPWKSKTDMNFFKTSTTNNIVVMGSNTLLSLRNANPLPNRLNIVLTRDPNKFNNDDKYKHLENIRFMDETMFSMFLEDPISVIIPGQYKFLNFDYKIFIIGGDQIYTAFCERCSTIWLTKIKANYECDLIFSYNANPNKYNCEIYYEDTELQIMRLTRQFDSLLK